MKESLSFKVDPDIKRRFRIKCIEMDRTGLEVGEILIKKFVDGYLSIDGLSKAVAEGCDERSPNT